MSVDSLVRAAEKLSDDDLLTLHSRVTSLASKARLRLPGFRERQQERFIRQRTVMIENTRSRRRCSLKGCERFTYKATLCRKHWDEVPHASKIGVMIGVLDASMRAADTAHRKIAREAKLRNRQAP